VLIPTIDGSSSFRGGANNNNNIGEQRVFLSKLLSLISVMTACAGDFMARPLRESVWPCVGRILGTFVARKKRSNQQRHFVLEETGSPAQSSPPLRSALAARKKSDWSESECGLLLATLGCLRRVYGIDRDVGTALSGLIPTSGTMLFPFLDDDDDDDDGAIAEACAETLRAMLRIDCDALWRPLLELSGKRTVPQCPLLLQRADGATTTTATSAAAGTGEKGKLAVTAAVAAAAVPPPAPTAADRLAAAAEELVAFVEALPEQSLAQ